MMLGRVLARTRRMVSSSFSGKNLLVTNTVSGAGLLMVGDMLQQRREGEELHDWVRSGRMFLVGLSQGPPHHFWYIWLDKKLPGKAAFTVGKKILADQLLAAPFFAFTFIYGASLLEGRSLSECWVEFSQKFPTIYLFDWVIWPPSQAINFLLVPAPYRVLYVNCVTVIWDIFLSYMKHKPDDSAVIT